MSGRHAREDLGYAAALSLAELAAAAPVGKAPKISGAAISRVLAYGPGAAIILDATDTVASVPSFDEDDPTVVVLLTYAEAVIACQPPAPRPGEPPVRPVPPVDFGRQLSARLAAEHAAGLLTAIDWAMAA